MNKGLSHQGIKLERNNFYCDTEAYNNSRNYFQCLNSECTGTGTGVLSRYMDLIFNISSISLGRLDIAFTKYEPVIPRF